MHVITATEKTTIQYSLLLTRNLLYSFLLKGLLGWSTGANMNIAIEQKSRPIDIKIGFFTIDKYFSNATKAR